MNLLKSFGIAVLMLISCVLFLFGGARLFIWMNTQSVIIQGVVFGILCLVGLTVYIFFMFYDETNDV